MDNIAVEEMQQGMTNAQTAALLEALKIIAEQADSLEDMKKALDDIQGQLNGQTSK